MRWLGPMLHLIYPPTTDPVAQQMAALLDEGRTYADQIEASRKRLVELADPLPATLTAIVEDL